MAALKSKNPKAQVAFVYERRSVLQGRGAERRATWPRRRASLLALDESYPGSTTDFSPIINKVISSKANALLGGGHYADGATLARQLHDQKAGLKWVTLLVAPDSPKFAELGDAAVGISVPSQWEPQVTFKPDFGPDCGCPSPRRSPTKYKIEPGYHAAGGYAAGLILQHAIEQAGSIDQAKVASRAQQDRRHHVVRPHQVLDRSEGARASARPRDGARAMAEEGRQAR